MKILLDGNDLIEGIAYIGSFENAIDFEGDLPVDFEENFQRNKYKFDDGKIVENENFSEENQEIKPVISPTQQMIGSLTKQVAAMIEQNKNTQLALGKLALDLAKKEGN